MHPAISVIFFTVMSGAGFGLIAMLGLGFPFERGAGSVFLVSALGAGLSVAGLLSSTFHLGHPERALNAFSQWRSSWLSREGVASVVTLILFGCYSLWWMATGVRIGWLGYLIAAGAVVTVFTTAMIYAQLKTVPHWNSGLTPAVYLGFSLCCGFVLASATGTAFILGPFPVALWAMAALIVAWGIKVAWWHRAASATLEARGSTPETATGLGFIGKVRLLEKPHSGENYLTREMIHRIGRKHAATLRLIALVVGGLAPFAIACAVYLTLSHPGWLGFAAALMIAGLFAERWLFFAEAEHAVSLYYR